MNRVFFALVIVVLGMTISAFAAVNPVIYQATGLTVADIQPVVDQFRRDISRGGTDNGDLAGPLPIGRREIDWENPTGDGFLIFPQKGALFSTGPLFTLRVSNDTGALNFSDIDPSYSSTFQPFGAPRMAANERFNGEIGVTFGIPEIDAPFPQGRYVNAVGIVFSDVDLQGPTYIRLFVSDSELLFDVPARSGEATLSFLGISFGDQNPIQGVAIQAGNAPLAPGRRDGDIIQYDPSIGLPPFVSDLVTIDRVIFGEPSSVPEPSTTAIIVLSLFILMLRLSPRRWF